MIATEVTATLPGMFTVLEGPPGCSKPLAERLRARGMTIVEGFRIPVARRSVVCSGVVFDAASAGESLLAALDGAGLLIEARAERAVVDRLVDDLRRLGSVDHRIVDGADTASGGPDLSVEARAILGLLAMGMSLAEAAHVLGIARRTADRRLAEARRGLGVGTTAEAIARARGLGWIDRPPGGR
jgi:DNA-binding CsgD family transcriptional regulator